MPWDPFGITAYHQKVRDEIARGTPGFAQSSVGDVLVSLEDGTPTHGHYLTRSLSEIIEEIIVDVARGDGIASPQTFSRSRVEYMITDRKAYSSNWPKKHAEARILEQFYIQGAGQGLLK